MVNFDKYKVNELKTMLKKREKPQTGHKFELIKR